MTDFRTFTTDNVVVPAENVIGAEGQGFKLAMGAFDVRVAILLLTWRADADCALLLGLA